MPHLQEKSVDDNFNAVATGTNAGATSSDLPIREAQRGYLNESEGLPEVLMTSSKIQNSPVKVESFGSTEEPRRSVSEGAFTPQASSAKQGMVTPSPYASIHRVMRRGPIMTIFGNKKLVPSPIRVRRRVSNSEDDGEDESPNTSMPQPSNLRYVESCETPQKPVFAQRMADGCDKDETPSKRPTAQLGSNASLVEKSRTARVDSPEYSIVSGATSGEETTTLEPPLKKKKHIISPSSSGEKLDDDEASRMASRGITYPPHVSRAYPHLPAYSRNPPMYPSHSASYPPPTFHAGFHGYAPYPPPPHFAVRPSAPPASFYPPYPAHPHMADLYPRHIVAGKYPPSFQGNHGPGMNRTQSLMTNEDRKRMVGPTDHAIKSVAEWQRAALTTGKPPSANRCVPLKEPIPSKYWGNAEKTKDAVLPDFHRLVNFPDYLAKTRNSSSGDSNQSGKKNCVMCGKLRVCSASSLVGRGRGITSLKHEETKAESTSPDDDPTSHIIPRQNKGLCTACDVTVWVVVNDGLEIKWCKGCKNFKPWAAFGDKGSATKCVRCRDRQREKYAMQKDEIRQRRFKRTGSNSSEEKTPPLAKESSNDSHVAAACGLRNLMNAANV